jgi:hypothetical protein
MVATEKQGFNTQASQQPANHLQPWICHFMDAVWQF